MLKEKSYTKIEISKVEAIGNNKLAINGRGFSLVHGNFNDRIEIEVYDFKGNPITQIGCKSIHENLIIIPIQLGSSNSLKKTKLDIHFFIKNSTTTLAHVSFYFNEKLGEPEPDNKVKITQVGDVFVYPGDSTSSNTQEKKVRLAFDMEYKDNLDIINKVVIANNSFTIPTATSIQKVYKARSNPKLYKLKVNIRLNMTVEPKNKKFMLELYDSSGNLHATKVIEVKKEDKK